MSLKIKATLSCNTGCGAEMNLDSGAKERYRISSNVMLRDLIRQAIKQGWELDDIDLCPACKEKNYSSNNEEIKVDKLSDVNVTGGEITIGFVTLSFWNKIKYLIFGDRAEVKLKVSDGAACFKIKSELMKLRDVKLSYKATTNKEKK